MSAFIVNDYHINALVTYGLQAKAEYWTGKERVRFSEDTAWALASKLYRANVKSVNFRYGDRNRTTGFKYAPVKISHLSAADIVKACDCLDYQSCELASWDRSEARKILQAIREEAVRVLALSPAWELQDPEAEVV